MSLFSRLVNLWQYFFPSKPNHQLPPVGTNAPEPMELHTEASPAISDTPGDLLLKQELVAQLPDPLPEQGQLMVRMQTRKSGGARWDDMQGVLLCSTLPTEKQVEEITASIERTIQDRGRLVIAQQKVFSDGILLLMLAYARNLPRGGKIIKI